MRTIEKAKLRQIGHLRGITQYEVLDDMSLLVLRIGDRCFLSQVKNWETEYNDAILSRINLFYLGKGQKAFECLGEEIIVK